MVENGILTHNYNHAEMNVGNYLLDKSMEKSRKIHANPSFWTIESCDPRPVPSHCQYIDHCRRSNL